ncbi:MAG TPA: efflux RND transporter periplasmic adaptor subunit [Flavisolibacter sp.]|jgi:hypothetical protein|nr:efflux RND transporter periplasmic adaptor subunit [Flavisolibacter sp.]
MKNRFTGKLIMLILMVAAVVGCKDKTTAAAQQEHQYTCPMHPQVVRDEPGQCPICGMDLVPLATGNELPIDSALLPLLKPSNTQISSNSPTTTAESEIRIFSVPVQGVVSYDTKRQQSISSRVSGRIERLYIKYNYQPVRKGQKIMEIYSPDLAAAQRDVIYISRNDNNPSLLQKAKQRLLLLGMSSTQIAQVIRSGRPVYSVPVYSSVSGYIVDNSSLSPAPNTSTPMAATSNPSTGDGMGGMGSSATAAPAPSAPPVNNAPVMIREGQYVSAGETVFNVYLSSGLVADFYFDPSLVSHITRGVKLTFHQVGNPDDIHAGTISLIEPVQRAGSSFVTARVYVTNNSFQPGQLLAGRIPVVARGWWLPETAVVGLGNRSIVFKKEGGVFVPRDVPVGIRAQGLVQILDSVANWQVARNASYMVGSESFIRLQNKQ